MLTSLGVADAIPQWRTQISTASQFSISIILKPDMFCFLTFYLRANLFLWSSSIYCPMLVALQGRIPIVQSKVGQNQCGCTLARVHRKGVGRRRLESGSHRMSLSGRKPDQILGFSTRISKYEWYLLPQQKRKVWFVWSSPHSTCLSGEKTHSWLIAGLIILDMSRYIHPVNPVGSNYSVVTLKLVGRPYLHFAQVALSRFKMLMQLCKSQKHS